MNQPRQLDSALYALIRDENIAAFNREKPEGTSIDFRDGISVAWTCAAGCTSGIDFSGAYFRCADLRGLDLRDIRWRGQAWPTRRSPESGSHPS